MPDKTEKILVWSEVARHPDYPISGFWSWRMFSKIIMTPLEGGWPRLLISLGTGGLAFHVLASENVGNVGTDGSGTISSPDVGTG